MWAPCGSNGLLLLIITVLTVNANAKHNALRNARSIELSSAQKLITDNRLPTDIEPKSYILNLYPDFETSTFTGNIKMNLTWKAEAKVIELHSHYDLQIDETNVRVRLLSGNAAYAYRNSNLHNFFFLTHTKYTITPSPEHVIAFLYSSNDIYFCIQCSQLVVLLCIR